MADTVTISSSVYVNDDASTTSRFTTFTLTRAGRQVLASINNIIDSGRPAGLSFTGTDLIDKADNLKAVECRGLIGPRANIAGFKEAVCFEGELLQLAYTLKDDTSRSVTGIITELNVRAGPGGRQSWRTDFVFHKVDALRFINSDLILRESAAS